MRFLLPYGKGKAGFSVEGSYEALEKKAMPQEGKSGSELVKEAIESPIGSMRLRELAKGRKSAVIILSDHTRPVPSKDILPAMLKEMREASPNISITLLVATGFHRPTTKAELRAKLGEKIYEAEKIIVHNSEDESAMADIGSLPSGARLVINKAAVECDLLASEGFIEPHFFSGFSGGRKSVLPGISAQKTVLGNHCAEFINSPYAKAGVLDGNPINLDMVAACRMAGLEFIVNCALDQNKKIAKAFAGDAIDAHLAGCEWLRPYSEAFFKEEADIAVTSNGGYPLDQNLYQAVKGMTAAEAASKEGSVIVIAAECSDGHGGEGFYNSLKNAKSALALENEILSRPMGETLPDQWESQILARILKSRTVIVAAQKQMKKIVEEMKMLYAESLSEAYELALSLKGPDAHTVVIEDGVSTIVRKS